MIRLLLEQAALGESGHILVRSKLRAVTHRMAFSDIKRSQIELVCNEILSNQAKYARGTGLVQVWESALCGAAIDLFAIDYGPGIADVAAAIGDGYTTAGTMGRGLGAIARLADQSGVYSLQENHGRDQAWHGVAIWARFYASRTACSCGYEAGAFVRPYQDQPYNGDCVYHRCEARRLRWMHLDALGHGTDAAQAVQGVDRLLDTDSAPEQVLANIHRFMQERRAAVGLAAELDFAARRLRLAGVGDISADIVRDHARQSVPFEPGVLGRTVGRMAPTELSLEPGDVLVTASDGLRRSWSGQSFPGLWRYHPQMIAYMLGALMCRNNDDKSIFVIRFNGGNE